MAIQKITTNAIEDSAINSAKIADTQIATSDIANNAITSAKLDSTGISVNITGGTISGATVSAPISGTTINNTTIGATTAASGKFTTIQITADTIQPSEGGTGADLSSNTGYLKYTAGVASTIADPLADGTTKLALSRGGLNTDVSAYNGIVKISSGAASAVSLPLSIGNGGTGAGTQAAAINALLPTQTSNANKTLTTDGSNVSWSTISTLLPTQSGNAGKSLVTDGSNVSWAVVSPIWTTIATATNATATSSYMCNTTSAAFTLTLPASPAANDVIRVADYAGTFATNNLTIARNGNNIMGLAEDMTVSTNYVSFTLTYIDATKGWRIT